MKKLFLTLLFVIPIHGYSQRNPCAGVTTQVNEFERSTSTISKPVGAGRLQALSLARITKGDSTLLALGISVFSGESDYHGTGVFVKLQDGTILERPSQRINCDWLGVDRYTLSGYIALTQEEFTKLTASPVMLLQVGVKKSEVAEKDGAKLMGYANCMK